VKGLLLVSLLALGACTSSPTTDRVLSDLDLAYSTATIAEQIYAGLPFANPAVVADLAKADLAARDALAIAHAAYERGDVAAVETAVASVRDALAIMGKIPTK
jgi:hypothetical protein